jgi:hypothetical protein
MHNHSDTTPSKSRSLTKAGWRISEWRNDVGVGRSHVYDLIKSGKIVAVKSGKATIIKTSPAEYLASLPAAR